MQLSLRRVADRVMMRLDALRRHLKIKSEPADAGFPEAVKRAVLKKVKPIIDTHRPSSGEQIISAVAERAGVRFESVHNEEDVSRLRQHYLHERRELGFGVLAEELRKGGSDALLFQLARPEKDARFVAVLNLQDSRSREYWDKGHELAHRLTEPAQKLLPFRRHRAEKLNPLERLIDHVTSDIVFYRELFEPIVRKYSKHTSALTLETVRCIRRAFAPTASLLSVANAAARYWPLPAVVLVARWRGRTRNRLRTSLDEALRVAVKGNNDEAASLNMIPFENMRVPHGSPLYDAYDQEVLVEGVESLATWTTSGGESLPAHEVFTSAQGFGESAYSILTAVSW